MDYENYHVYEVDGAAGLAKIDEYEARRKAAAAAGQVFAVDNGGISLVLRGRDPYGILLAKDVEPRKGWKVAKRQGLGGGTIAVPNGRHKEGRIAESSLRAMESFDTEVLARQLGATSMVMRPAGDGRVYLNNSHVFKLADRWFLIDPKDGDKPAKPYDGCRLLKLSEFFAIKEQLEAGKEKAA